VELIAPRTLAPGASVQLRVIVHRSDGSTEDATSTSVFSSQSRDVLDIAPNGVATGMALGDSVVSAAVQNRFPSATREIVVVPDGTFRVTGQVVEDDSSDLPVGGATVTADAAPAATTDIDGRYRLYGVRPHALLRINKSGYVAKDVPLDISDHHIENVRLTFAGPRDNFAGTYQMVIEASPSCRGAFPDNLLTRRYEAVVSQNGAEIRAVLGGATFANGRFGTRSNVIRGRVEQSQMVLEFIFYGAYYEDPSLLEIIDDANLFTVHGQVRFSSAPSRLEGTLPGWLMLFPGTSFGYDPALAACPSGFSDVVHKVTLTR
jgi:hypothetical protein